MGSLASVTPDEALRDIKGYAGANRITYSGHARDQMRARGAQREDVHHALSRDLVQAQRRQHRRGRALGRMCFAPSSSSRTGYSSSP